MSGWESGVDPEAFVMNYLLPLDSLCIFCLLRYNLHMIKIDPF